MYDELQRSGSLLKDVLAKIASISHGCEALDCRLKRLSVHNQRDVTVKDARVNAGEHAGFPFLKLPSEIQLQVMRCILDPASLCRLSQVRFCQMMRTLYSKSHACGLYLHGSASMITNIPELSSADAAIVRCTVRG